MGPLDSSASAFNCSLQGRGWQFKSISAHEIAGQSVKFRYLCHTCSG